MPTSVSDLVASHLGGVAHLHSIRAADFSQADIERSIAGGQLRRIRRAWYEAPGAQLDVVRAVSHGGVLTAVSAARLYGLWVPPDSALHVAVARNASRLRPANDCRHWRRTPGAPLLAVEPIIPVLQHALDCLSEEMAIVLMDSALNRHTSGITLRDLQNAFGSLPQKYRKAVAKADPLAQSGIETIFRLRMRSRRVSLGTQVYRPGVGRVDFLIGDRLVVEVDGRETHDTEHGFITDRERDLTLFDGDHLVLRLTYAHVMYRWPEVEAIILAKIRRREHLWPRHR